MAENDFTSLIEATEQLTKNLWRIMGLADTICRSAGNGKEFFNPTAEVAAQIYELGFEAMEALCFLEQKCQLWGKNRPQRLQDFTVFKLRYPGGRPEIRTCKCTDQGVMPRVIKRTEQLNEFSITPHPRPRPGIPKNLKKWSEK